MTHRPAPSQALGREEAQALGGLVALFLLTAAWWALALWPLEQGPAWLERTRYVCFGVGESGLPDTGGWIGLVGGPLGMLVILLVGWRAGVRGLLSRARTSGPVAGALTVMALGCVVLVTGAGVRVQQAGAAAVLDRAAPGLAPESHTRLDRRPPSLVLMTQAGEPLDITSLRGRAVLVTFVFAHCDAVCPLLVRDALAAVEAVRGTEHEAALLAVTLDPWRDTPSRLPAIARAWGLEDGAWVLGGRVEDVEAVLDAWEVPRSRNLTTGEIVHPSLVYVIDPQGRIAFASSGGADTLIGLLRRL